MLFDDSSPRKISKYPDTRLEPRSDKESPEVEITNDEEVEITNVVIPVNVNEEEEEITEKLQELMVTDTTPTPSSSLSNTKLSTTNRLLSLFNAKLACFKRYKSFFQELLGHYGYLLEHLKARFLSRKSFDTLADHLQAVTVESLPTMVDKHIKEQVETQVPEQVKVQVPVSVGNYRLVDASIRSYMSRHILHVHPTQPQTTSVLEQQYQLYLSMKADLQLQQQDIAIWLALQMKFETLQVPQTTCKTPVVRPRDQDDPHDDAHPEEENSAKRQKTSEYEAHVTGESFGQVNEKEQDDDEVPTKQVSQDIIEEVSLTINELKLKKITDEMLRQRCTLGDEHQYHIDQMKNFLKSDIVWESKKEILASPHPQKTTPLKGSSGPEKIVLSLYKFPAIIFNDVDIEERTSR
ncbi:hypothetical protein Tco_0845299 [Tanacetum coccineum]